MNPDLIRLILVVLGVLLVVGIYAWDRYQRTAPHHRPARRARGGLPFRRGDRVAPAARSEPHLTDDIAVEPADDHTEAAWPAAEKPAHAGDIDPEPAELGDWSTPPGDADPQFSMELKFDAHADSDYLNTDPALLDEVERKIVVINLVAGKGVFSGPAIEKACAAVEMRIGDMAIYHRYDSSGQRVVFSMASMVEPGSFPEASMAGFSTPGLAIFTQLPGVLDGVVIYQDMLATAKRLADLLQGELRDERHNKLTRQMQDHTRDSIIEHRRKVNLARSRH